MFAWVDVPLVITRQFTNNKTSSSLSYMDEWFDMYYEGRLRQR